MTLLKRTASDRLAEMAGDRIWPLVFRYGTHSDPVKRALRAWGAIWKGIHESDEVLHSTTSAIEVLPGMATEPGGEPEMGNSTAEDLEGSGSVDPILETEGTEN